MNDTRTAAPAFQRGRVYQSWDDVARLEERTDQSFRRIPRQRMVLLTAPAAVAAGDALVYTLVTGTGEVAISAARAGQSVCVKSRGGALTVRDAGGARIDGATTNAVGALVARTYLWTGQDWSVV